MKTVLTIAVVSTLGLSAGAAFGAPHSDVATVISSTPIVERVSAPRRECFNEQVTAYDERRIARPVREEYVTDSRPNSGPDPPAAVRSGKADAAVVSAEPWP